MKALSDLSGFNPTVPDAASGSQANSCIPQWFYSDSHRGGQQEYAATLNLVEEYFPVCAPPCFTSNEYRSGIVFCRL
jgi:hypothetical protein